MISLYSLFLFIKQYKYGLEELIPRITEFYVGLTYSERHAIILPLRVVGGVTLFCMRCLGHWVLFS